MSTIDQRMRALRIEISPDVELFLEWARYRDVSGSDPHRGAVQISELAQARIKADREHPFAHYVLGHLRLSAGDEEKALRHFTLAIRGDATNLDAQRYHRLLSGRLDRRGRR